MTPGDRDVIRLDITDGFNRLINQMFNVLITPIDTVLPDIVNKGVTLKEKDRTVLNTNLLSATDLNSPDEKLLFTVTKLPLKGHLENSDQPGIPITRFTQLDLAANKIVYLHTNDDEKKFDNFEFEVTDGRNKIFRTFRIKIRNVNNKIPVLTTSTVNATEGLGVVITPFEIRAVDNDTKSNDLVFKIHQRPLHGDILRDGVEAVDSFTQVDIDNNRISYRHNGSLDASDKVTITVSDGLHKAFVMKSKPKELQTKPVTVHIKINQVDNSAPTIKRNLGAPTLMEDKNGPYFLLSDSQLKVVDRDSPKKGVKFIIRKKPKFGKLVLTKNRKKAISNFTLFDLNKLRVLYLLNNNSDSTSDVFIFDVVDSNNNWLRNQQFYINWAWISIPRMIYAVNETVGTFEIELMRRGYLGETSFAQVEFKDGSAKVLEDYKLRSNGQVQFNPGETIAKLKIKIVNNTKYEKSKTFSAKLKQGINALVNRTVVTTVTIIDKEDGKLNVIYMN